MSFLAELAVVLAIAFCAAFGGFEFGSNHVQTRWDKEKNAATQAMVKDAQTARKTEQVLQATADQTLREKDLEIARIVRQRDAALLSLRDRPSRPPEGAAPAPAKPGAPAQGCDGPQLYREDAEFLVREAARADVLRAQLNQCQSMWDEAQTKLNQE